MPNKIYYKIPHEIASEPAYVCTLNKKYGGAKYKYDPSGTPKSEVTRKTKLSKLTTITRDLKTSGIPYIVETTDTHVIIHN